MASDEQHDPDTVYGESRLTPDSFCSFPDLLVTFNVLLLCNNTFEWTLLLFFYRRIQFFCASSRFYLQTLQQVLPLWIFCPAHPLQITEALWEPQGWFLITSFTLTPLPNRGVAGITDYLWSKWNQRGAFCFIDCVTPASIQAYISSQWEFP